MILQFELVGQFIIIDSHEFIPSHMMLQFVFGGQFIIYSWIEPRQDSVPWQLIVQSIFVDDGLQLIVAPSHDPSPMQLISHDGAEEFVHEIVLNLHWEFDHSSLQLISSENTMSKVNDHEIITLLMIGNVDILRVENT